MALFPSAGGPTDAQALAAAKASILADIQNLRRVLIQTYSANYDRFWNTPAGGPNPAAMAGAFGKDAAELFQRSAALAAFLQAQFPGAVPAAKLTVPAGYAVTANADGTVTVTKAS
jgi:hypothetical protein